MSGPNAPSLRAEYAKAILRQENLKQINLLQPTNPLTELPPKTIQSSLPDTIQEATPKGAPICIVGAGAAGLAVALCLQIAGYTNITIYESTDRHGGRCYTYKFQNGGPCDHNYYDVGAMRIPQTSTMQSTFNLITYLNDEKQQDVQLAEYIYDAGGEPSSYFGSDRPLDNTKFTNFMSGSEGNGGILADNFFIGPNAKPFDEAFQNYLGGPDKPDNYSTRAFLMIKNGSVIVYPVWAFADTAWAEMLDTSTGLFDQAFMETICDYYDFYLAKEKPWYRVEGGMQKLTDAMHDVITSQGARVHYQSPVAALTETSDANFIEVTYRDSQGVLQPRESYSAVFNTTAFGALQRMDLQGLNLSQLQQMAIRSLSYDRATKIAIKFSHNWWRDIWPQSGYKYGGVSSSDLSISNVVYPSWDDGNQPHTIIVSYSWAQDATRMAALVKQQDQEIVDKSDALIQLVFSNLVKIWAPVLKDQTKIQAFQANLDNYYQSHHAFAWSHNSQTTGGFALFGPGQFSDQYVQFTKPSCGNKFWICGEAVSAHHAWISGALDSAYHAVFTWMGGNRDRKGQKALKESSLGGGPGKHPAEVDETLVWHTLRIALDNRYSGDV
ncbi:FAD/NAD(P)-binding domain-containing protein [Myriangium duriaei CBS 260.36]|uniref:FAD/NAD(P)-binding domain-containing protein n=1 Tax=Myriangium duriaei CBS 260.36 TaxID=1168546 RepID=A0A9P4MG39_9PEZI|nr:FAD/NAD(P)-binding domain-containing protein [Myriangium duriaei CBS 260.36]